MKTIKTLTLALIVAVTVVSCKKDSQDGTTNTTQLKVWLTDAPGNFQQVNVDIIGVEVKTNTNATVNLNISAGVYNLLNFANGIDTLIASANVPVGELSQIRLILGPNNSVMLNNVLYPLSTPSAMQSGLKLNIHSTLVAGVVYNMLLDFDANQSIVRLDSVTYQLKPVIRVISVATSGSIHGNISPALALPAIVTATDGVNTYSTNSYQSSYFLLQGLPTGIYTVVITPQIPYIQQTIANVSVTAGTMVELGSLIF